MLNEPQEVRKAMMTIKSYAHRMVTKNINSGCLARQPCETCGEKNAHAHHDNYFKPLDVRWLCKKHHNEHHNNERKKLRPKKDVNRKNYARNEIILNGEFTNPILRYLHEHGKDRAWLGKQTGIDAGSLSRIINSSQCSGHNAVLINRETGIPLALLRPQTWGKR